MSLTAEEKRIRKVVNERVNKWRRMLGLGLWKIEVCLVYSIDCETPSLNTLAQCTATWQYRLITIEVNLHEALTQSDEDLEKMVIHELCHALVCEMRENDPDSKHEERVVTGLTDAFWYVKHWNETNKAGK